MNKQLIAMALTAPLVLGLGACGGGDDSGSSTPATSAPVAAASPSPTTAVDTFCTLVDQYRQRVEELAATPDPNGAADLRQRAQQLQDTAAQLTQELMDDPTQGPRVQQCTATLQEALAIQTAPASIAPASPSATS